MQTRQTKHLVSEDTIWPWLISERKRKSRRLLSPSCIDLSSPFLISEPNFRPHHITWKHLVADRSISMYLCIYCIYMYALFLFSVSFLGTERSQQSHSSKPATSIWLCVHDGPACVACKEMCCGNARLVPSFAYTWLQLCSRHSSVF